MGSKRKDGETTHAEGGSQSPVAEDYEPFRYALITTLDGKDLKSSKPSTA